MELSELAQQPTAQELMEQAEARAAAAGTRLDVGLMLEDREADRR